MITMVQMTVGYASDGIWTNADKFNRTLGRERPLQTNRSSWTVPTAGHVTRDQQLGLRGLSSWSSIICSFRSPWDDFGNWDIPDNYIQTKLRHDGIADYSPQQQAVLTNWPLHPHFREETFLLNNWFSTNYLAFLASIDVSKQSVMKQPQFLAQKTCG